MIATIFDEREPEFQLTEDLDTDHVDCGDEGHDGQHPDPARYSREPEAHVHADGGGVEDGDKNHLEDEGPADEETGEWMEIVRCELAEGSRDGMTDQHFAQRTHHHEDGGTADDVGQQHGRTCGLDRLRGPHEQPRADGRAQGHEADVPSGQSPAQTCVLCVIAMGGRLSAPTVSRRHRCPTFSQILPPATSAQRASAGGPERVS